MKLSNGVLYSIIAHAALVLMMILQVVFYPTKALDLSTAIRVDMVGLPEKNLLPSQEPNQLPEKKAETEPEVEKIKPEITQPLNKEEVKKKLPEKKSPPEADSVNINKVKSKQKEALAKLKASAAIEKLKNEVNESTKSDDKTKPVFKGRILSAGTSLTGLDKLQSDSYLSQLDAKIKSHWTLPQWLMGKSLRARVLIKFDEAGNLISNKIIQSSGQPTYDEYCLLTITKSAPLPKAPEKFSSIYKIDGVVIGFPD